MATANPAAEEERGEGGDPADVGEKLHEDTKLRFAQRNGKSENCIEANLTQFGKQRFGIEPGDPLEVAVHERGIVIRPIDTSPKR